MPRKVINYNLDYLGRHSFRNLFKNVYIGASAKVSEAIEIFKQFGAEKVAEYINTPIRTNGGQTLLHAACYGSGKEAVATIDLLIKNGADLLAEDNSGRTAFDIAANAGDPDVIEYFLKLPVVRELLIGHPDSNDRTPLHALCMPGSSPKEKRRGMLLVESLLKILACYRTKEEKIKALQTKDRFNITPLMYAKRSGFEEILEVAEKLGISREDIPDIDFRDPIQRAGLDVDYYGRPYSKLMEYAFEGKDKQVAGILSFPTNANNPTLANYQFGNRNAFHYAICGLGTPETVRLVMVDRRNNPLAVDSNGSHALHFGAARGNKAVMEMLLSNRYIRKRLINKTDNYGMTPLHALAMSFGGDTRLETIDLLVTKHGANLFAKNIDGLTPFDVAMECGNGDVARHLSVLMDQQEKRQRDDSKNYLWSFGKHVQKASSALNDCLKANDKAVVRPEDSSPERSPTLKPTRV